MLNFFKDLAQYAGWILVVVNLSVALIRPLRQGFINIIGRKLKEKESEDLFRDIQVKLNQIVYDLKFQSEADRLYKESLKCIIRNSLTHLYYQYTNCSAIPGYEKENILRLYESYRAIGGNSFVDNCVNELLAKPIENVKQGRK